MIEDCLLAIVGWLANRDGYWVLVQDIRRQLLDLLRECGREEQSLSVWSDLIHDRAKLVLESKVKHSVSLIHYQESAPRGQRDSLLPQEFNQLSRGGDADLVHSLLQIFP